MFCVVCKKLFKHQTIYIRLSCGHKLHPNCLSKLWSARKKSLLSSKFSKSFKRRAKARGSLSLPAYLKIPKCPSCRHFIIKSNMQYIIIYNRTSIIESETWTENTISDSSSTDDEQSNDENLLLNN